ncbi:N-acyl homoserine lactonase family protein [Microlunatus soli]|uniref:Glyoxylase, beta-lactamase superfamily II n=1 Tax=Microlunatus soli TaxID=630515 RepID=A0A1H1TTG7_9ACTN|nr:N-acyl homoserine lactonase family protein [Microlunatus soli]SDS63498.1 Glyoxylase, beta-lactamase superfamily II [Microlunatus soli]
MTGGATRGVFALRYAYRTVSVRGEHFYGHPDGCLDPWPIDYFTWVIIDGDRTVVIDAGFTPATAERRGDRPYLATPPELLRRLGTDASEVTDLVLTHLHYDHTGFVGDYPNARLWLQRSELEFWSSPITARAGFDHLLDRDDLETITGLVDDGRVELLDGDATINDRVSVHRVGGHTPGTQVVRARTGAGDAGVIVLASDSSHFYANIDQDKPYGVVCDLPDMYRAFDRLRELAGPTGVIVPGHDPRVKQHHPTVAGTDELVYDLTTTTHIPTSQGDSHAPEER